MTTDVTAYPLSWPLGRERTAREDRKMADCELVATLVNAWRSGELRLALEDSARLDWLVENATSMERRESGWQVDTRHAWIRGADLRECIDAMRAGRKGDTAIDGVQGGGA